MDEDYKFGTIVIVSVLVLILLLAVGLEGLSWYTDYKMAKEGLCWTPVEGANRSPINYWQRCK